MKVGVFIPCFVNHFLPEVGEAVVRLLEKVGVDFFVPKGQTCCGQPAFNVGYPDLSIPSLKTLLPLFEDADIVVSPSGSCTAMIKINTPKLVPELKKVSSKFMEVTEFIYKYKKEEFERIQPEMQGRACIHVGCHLMRMLNVYNEPIYLLKKVKGLEIIPLEADKFCCGFGGMFSVKFPNLSVAIGKRRIEEALKLNLDYIISTDPSCMMQMGSILNKIKSNTKVIHITQVLSPGA